MESEPLPEPFQTPSREWSAYEVAQLLAGWLGRLAHPVLIGIEDLHWSDVASLDVLRNLSGRVDDQPVLIIGTYRTEELHPRHPLWTLLPEIRRTGGRILDVNRLTKDEVFALVRAELSQSGHNGDVIASAIYRRTAGLPLFVRELLHVIHRTGALPREGTRLPDIIQQSFDTRLERLSNSAQEVLQTSAVIGHEFTEDLLIRTNLYDEDLIMESLQEAMKLQLIHISDAGHFQFQHGLVREVLLSRLIGVQRRRLHASVAKALSTELAQDDFRLAFHLARSGDPQGMSYLIQAAHRQLQTGALGQAVERYEEVLSVMPERDARRPEMLLRLAVAVRWWNAEQARGLWHDASRLAAETGDKVVEIWADYCEVADELLVRGNLPSLHRIETLYDDQNALLSEQRYQELETSLFGQALNYPRVAYIRIMLLAYLDKVNEAQDLLAQIRLRDNSLLSVEAAMNLAVYNGDFHEAALQAAVGTKKSLEIYNYRSAVLHQLNNLYFSMLVHADDPDGMDKRARELLRLEELARKRSGLAYLPGQKSMIGFYQYVRGDWNGAKENILDYVRKEESPHPLALWFALVMLLDTNHSAEARTLVERWPLRRPEDALPLASPVLAWGHAMQAIIRVETGELVEAKAWLEAGEQVKISPAVQYTHLNLQLGWAAYYRKKGELHSAYQASIIAIQCAEDLHAQWWVIKSYRMAGEILLDLAQNDEAQVKLERARELAERCRLPYEVTLIRLIQARCIRETAAASEALLEIRQAFATLGADRMVELVNEMIEKRLGQRLAEDASATIPTGKIQPVISLTPAAHKCLATAILPDGITERESEVIKWAAQGLTNREIADKLFLSPKTVDRHLGNIFNKTGVGNRTALAAYAARQGLLQFNE